LLFVRPAIYTRNSVADQTCTVSFTDSSGIKHSAVVTADSLFEAAILGLKVLRSSELKEPPGRATVFEIEVRNPAVRHHVSLVHVAKWLNGPAASPRESMKKVHLRKLLASK
jgi:hypothetical protein